MAASCCLSFLRLTSLLVQREWWNQVVQIEAFWIWPWGSRGLLFVLCWWHPLPRYTEGTALLGLELVLREFSVLRLKWTEGRYRPRDRQSLKNSMILLPRRTLHHHVWESASLTTSHESIVDLILNPPLSVDEYIANLPFLRSNNHSVLMIHRGHSASSIPRPDSESNVWKANFGGMQCATSSLPWVNAILANCGICLVRCPWRFAGLVIRVHSTQMH